MSIAILIIVILVIKNNEKEGFQNIEPMVSRVIESDTVRYLNRYNMAVDYYNNEAGTISNYLSNALKFKVLGANPKEVIEGVSKGKYHFGIVKENLLKDAFYGEGVFSEQHINLRIMCKMFPVSLFFISDASNQNYVSGINDIKNLAEERHINIGVYSPRYYFPNKVKSDEKDPSLSIYYKLFNHLNIKPDKTGKRTYTLKIYSKRNELLVALKDPSKLDFCCIYDSFYNNDILKNWNKKIDAKKLQIFGLNDISSGELKYLFPRMKISNLDVTDEPYKTGKNLEGKELDKYSLIIRLIKYFFMKDSYYYRETGNYTALKNEWDTILKNAKDKTKLNLLKQRNDLITELIANSGVRIKQLNIRKISNPRELITLKRKCLILEKKGKYPLCKKLKPNSGTTLKEVNNSLKKLTDEAVKIPKDIMYNMSLKKYKVEKITKKSIGDLKIEIINILSDYNKDRRTKKQINFDKILDVNLSKYAGKSFPPWAPLSVSELNAMDSKKFDTFYSKTIKTINNSIENGESISSRKGYSKQKNQFKSLFSKTRERELNLLFNEKNVSSIDKTNEPKGYIDITKYRHPMFNKSMNPITLKTIQEYYVMFTEEDVADAPVYNLVYSFVKLPNDIKARQRRLLIPTDYSMPLHNGVRILYTKYKTEEDTDKVCRNRIGSMDCIIKKM